MGVERAQAGAPRASIHVVSGTNGHTPEAGYIPPSHQLGAPVGPAHFLGEANGDGHRKGTSVARLGKGTVAITTVEEINDQPISLSGRTVMTSVTERLLSQARDGVRLVPILEADRVISGDTAAQKLAGISVPLFHFENLDSSVGDTSFGRHVDTVFNSAIDGFRQVARTLERNLINNAERMTDSHALTLRLREVLTQLSAVADGSLQSTTPELAQFIRNVHVFAQDVEARRQAGVYVDPIETQMFEAAQTSFRSSQQLEVLDSVIAMPEYASLRPHEKDAVWQFALLGDGSQESIKEYTALLTVRDSANTPIERTMAGTIAELWEGFADVLSVQLHPALPEGVRLLITQGADVMQDTLRDQSTQRPLEETRTRLQEEAATIRRMQQKDFTLSPVAEQVVEGIEAFLQGLRQYQRVEAIISRPNAQLLTHENLERMLSLEQFAEEHGQEIGALRGYAYAIDAAGIFAYMIQPVEGYPTETAYLLDHIQRKMTSSAALNPETWEARKIAGTPLPAVPQFVGSRWGTMLLYDEGERQWVWGYPPAPEGYAEAYKESLNLAGLAEKYRRKQRAAQEQANTFVAGLAPEQRQLLESRARELLLVPVASHASEILRLAAQVGWKLPVRREISVSGREYIDAGGTTQEDFAAQAQEYLRLAYGSHLGFTESARANDLPVAQETLPTSSTLDAAALSRESAVDNSRGGTTDGTPDDMTPLPSVGDAVEQAAIVALPLVAALPDGRVSSALMPQQAVGMPMSSVSAVAPESELMQIRRLYRPSRFHLPRVSLWRMWEHLSPSIEGSVSSRLLDFLGGLENRKDTSESFFTRLFQSFS